MRNATENTMTADVLVMIPVSDIGSHPANPRKNIGDITELVGSIKINGIMQNLTVVPNPDEGSGKPPYRALIGHRRLAAAKQAGLEAVPCMIAYDLDEKAQVGIMLSENMQRSDLTVIEEADGLQMMLDLGDTVSQVCETTGFSESKVRCRLKLTELAALDRESYEKSFERGGTLADYEKISKIKDKEVQKELLQAIGTNSFDWKLSQANEKEKREELREKAREVLSAFAECTEEFKKDVMPLTDRIGFLSFEQALKYEPPQDSSEKKYIALISPYGVTLYKEKDAEEPANNKDNCEETAKETETILDERRRALMEIDTQMNIRWTDFIKNFKGLKRESANRKLIAVYALFNAIRSVMLKKDVITQDEFEEIYDLSENEEYNELDDYGKCAEYISDHMEQLPPDVQMVHMLYAYTKINIDTHFYNWDCSCDKKGAEGLRTMYEMLNILGYEISDEERQIIDGTHELYLKEEQGGN